MEVSAEPVQEAGGRCFVLPLRAKSGRGVGAEGGLERAV